MRVATSYFVRTIMDDQERTAQDLRRNRNARELRAEQRRARRRRPKQTVTAQTATAEQAAQVPLATTQPDVVVDLREEVVGNERSKGLVRT